MMKSILFIVFSFLEVVIGVDRVPMLELSRAFQPHPPGWSTQSSFAYCKWKGVECNRTNHYQVISINISGLSLAGVISPAITSLPGLVEVYLQNNNLSGELPGFPKHVNFIYKPGNPLLKHKSGGNGMTTRIVIGSIIGGALLLINIIIMVYVCFLRKSTVENGRGDFRALISEDHFYSIETIRRATNDFSQENILGQGGFGVVYKGVQDDGTMIAIKRKDFGVVGEKAMSEFNNEIGVFTSLRHKHLVSLLGFCDDGNEKMLVYEYMPGGTLAHRLFDWSNRGYTPLTWNERITIALDVARGVQYLHGLGTRNYIHRDLKPSNILLGDGMRAKISDFGCMKLAPEGQDSIETTTVMGTFGYIDPHYVGSRRVTKKADVSAFGVILMEMITGRKANDETLSEEEQNLVIWLRPKIKDTNFLRSIDRTIAKDEETMENIKKIAKWAEYCTSPDVETRPDIFQTVNWLVPLVERWEAPPSEEDSDSEDTRTLLEKLHSWKTEAGEGTSTSAYGGSKDESSQTHPSTSGLRDIEMTHS